MPYFYLTEACEREVYVDVRKSLENPTLHVLRDITIEESAGGVEDKTVHTVCGEEIFDGYYLNETSHLYAKDVEQLQERLCSACLAQLDRNGKLWKLIEEQRAKQQ